MGEISGSGWRRDPEWAATGHWLGGLVRDAMGTEHTVLVVHGRGDRYVQLHAVEDEVYAEADSGEFGDAPLTPAQQRRLRELGWWLPDDSGMRPGPANYWLRRDERWDLYELVLMLVATLAEAYGSSPDDIAVDGVGCGQCEGDPPRVREA